MTVKYDRATKAWFNSHIGQQTTVCKCEKCGLFFKLMCPAEYDTGFNKNNNCNAEMNRNCCKCTLKWLQSEETI